MSRMIIVFGASMLLIAAFPLLIAIALGILACGEHPLFKQMRVGMSGSTFSIFKFRTLAIDESSKPHFCVVAFALVGSALRRTRLDELPQLWNIIRGEMTVVGPRPLTVEDFMAMPLDRSKRLSVRPGLTGLSQVQGGQLLSPQEKLALDLLYIEKRSTRLDLCILLRTAGCVWSGDVAALRPYRNHSASSLPKAGRPDPELSLVG